uniref:PhzF family phenazine biosynthesis protein n=1 Tax=Candidatus Fimivicinus sp. TaxID=3056640 RepID=UPI003FF09025
MTGFFIKESSVKRIICRNRLFRGNPARVYLLDHAVSDELMQKSAFENNLAETAFLVEKDDTIVVLRHFKHLFTACFLTSPALTDIIINCRYMIKR